MNPSFWQGRKVFLTGHTGFKGAWLALWLEKVGADVTAFSLDPPTTPSLFEVAQVAHGITATHGDIRDYDTLAAALRDSGASVVLHLAAQATVADDYRDARGTFATNLTGTLNLLDAMRDCPDYEIGLSVELRSDRLLVPLEPGKAKRGNPVISKDISIFSWRTWLAGTIRGGE